MVYVLSIPIIILYFVFGKSMIHIFMNQSTGEAVDTGIKFLRIVAPFYIIASTKLIADGVLRGAGAMKLFMFATFTDLVLRVVLAKILSGQFGSVGIWCAWPIGWTIATILSVMFYLKGKWKNKVETVAVTEQ